MGAAIAAPVGPVGVLCVSRTLERGRLVGLVSGLGAATADTFYAALAGLGITPITDFLRGNQQWMGLAGGALLIFLGIGSFLKHSQAKVNGRNGRGLLSAYTSSFALTVSNPMTLVAFLAVFGGLAVAESPHWGWIAAGVLISGVFTGSAIWWLGLALLTGLIRGGVTEVWMRRMNHVVGVFLLIAGAVIIWQGFQAS